MFSLIIMSLPEIITIVLAGIALIQILYYCCLFFRLSFYKRKGRPNTHQYPISIVIAAKDQAHHLINLIPKLLEQNYPTFELVIVSDNSNDETAHLVKEFMQSHENIKFTDLTSSVTTIKGKKFPISIGIKTATYDHILFTEPDCIPASKEWLSHMARNFQREKEIVVGYSTFENKKGLFNALMHYDQLHNAILYFSSILAKMPIMGNGKNMAYSREIFYDRKGFAGLSHVQLGEDDLFINRVATPNNCAIEISPKAHVIASTRGNAKNWFLTKRFRYSTRNLYTSKVRFHLSLYGFTSPLFYIFLGLALYLTISAHNMLFLYITCGIFFLKLLFQYLSFGFAAAKLNEKRITPYIFILDIISTFINALIYLRARLSSKK